ncbi:aminoglycoside phosphotransferase family protein [Brachybacterium sp. AOP43-C2-M15]|uniref:aminoglycoside phosphotransferase family protein n=1 Tax=Brachybacterium sp. AOP43-C2-M15 TaxID=3457661 RepID=UPI00403331C5
MISVPAPFRAMPRWWHDEEGRAWLDRLPDLVGQQCARWDLDVDGIPLHGSNALVVPVRRGSLELALRLCPPADDLSAEVAALRHWDGRGVVLLHETDLPAGALLLERLDPARSLAAVPPLEAAVLLGALTRRLAIPAPADAPSTRDIAAQEASAAESRWEALGRPLPRALLAAAIAAAGRRAAGAPGDGSVDGDLHHEQVLAGRRHPWTVVDPVLLRGDREYDLGRVLWSRLDELPGEEEVRAVAGAFVESARVPAERARDWVLVRSLSYLLWGLEQGLTLDPPRCRRLLEVFA